VEEQATNAPNRLLAELTSVMRATAETSRESALEQCRTDGEAFIERLHEIAEEGVEGLTKTAEDDVATIEGQSKATVERVRGEAERRIGRRREILEQEVQEFKEAVDREIERVEGGVAEFEKELADFFGQMEGSDPETFASMASKVPDPPALEELDLDALASQVRERHEAIARAAASPEPSGKGSKEKAPRGEEGELPPCWWLDSPSTLAAEAKDATKE
jgi:hypothetical protein